MKGAEEYNPDCDLAWVGDVVKTIKSGFAVKADSGYKCSSLIRHVIDLHLIELKEKGVLSELWRKYRAMEDEGVCKYGDDAGSTHAQANRNLKAEADPATHNSHSAKSRILNVQAKAASDGDETDGDTLTLEQMAGTFVLRWGAVAVAVIVSCITALTEKLKCFQNKDQKVEKVVNREHGPIIGMPPPVNKWVVQNKRNKAMDVHDSSNSANRKGCVPFNDGKSQQPTGAWQAELADLVEQRNTLDDQRKALDVKMELLLQQHVYGPKKETSV